MTETYKNQLVKALLYLERYAPKSLLTIEDKLEIAQANILEFISTTKNQRQIRAYIRKELTLAFGTFSDDMLEDIENISGLSWDKFGTIMATSFVTDNLAKQFKKFKEVDQLTKSKLLDPKRLILGNNLDDMKNQMILGANNKLRSAILKGFNDKVGIDAINKEVKTIIGNLSRNQAKTVTRTVLLNAIDEAKDESMKFFEDEIEYYIYSSVMDSRTSKYCFMANGYKTKDKATAKYKPKSHWNCRSMWIEETELTRQIEEEQRIVSWDRKKVNHRDGTTSTKFKVGEINYVPKNASRETIFKTWSQSEQINFLGKKRYRLYQQGKIELKDAIDISRNSLIPLDLLEKRLKQ